MLTKLEELVNGHAGLVVSRPLFPLPAVHYIAISLTHSLCYRSRLGLSAERAKDVVFFLYIGRGPHIRFEQVSLRLINLRQDFPRRDLFIFAVVDCILPSASTNEGPVVRPQIACTAHTLFIHIFAWIPESVSWTHCMRCWRQWCSPFTLLPP